MEKWNHLFAPTLALIALAFTGCDQQANSKFCGKWRYDENAPIVEFRPSGSFIIHEGNPKTGTWKLISSDKATIIPDNGKNTATATLLNDDELVISSPGTTAKVHRYKQSNPNDK